MRVPAFLAEHPVETLVAGVLLLILVLGGGDHHADDAANATAASGAPTVTAAHL